jgi:hypothetical protein
LLAGKGFVAEHVFDIHMERAGDSEIWSHAEITGAITVSEGEGFVAMATSSSSGFRGAELGGWTITRIH